MKTTIYFVRHAESPYVAGEERSRGLSAKGKSDACKVKTILDHAGIDVFISSPYARAIQTISDAVANNEIIIFEDLREREIGTIPDHKFKDAKWKVYNDFEFCFPDGESSIGAQQRAIKTFMELLRAYEGKKIAIGTHGDIMTLMLNYFDKCYHYEFWESTTMPDIYKLEFEGIELIHVTRLWE
jgi:2,3-bisphosphoglycerate-dependent phosphoglycerate mutase